MSKLSKHSGKFRYDTGTTDYQCTVSRPYQWWWWLLIPLMLLPLFIRCEREVKVTVVDLEDNPIENVEVGITYTAHFLYKDKFFCSEPVQRYASTGSDGTVTIAKLPCSVFSYIFYPLSQMTVTADPPLQWEAATVEKNFHFTRHVKFVLEDGPIQLRVKVIDAMTKEPLPDAEVLVTKGGTSTGTTDSQGIAILSGVKPRNRISLAARKKGYESNDSAILNVKARSLLDSIPVIPLTRVYECDDNVQFQSTYQPKVEIKDIDMHKDSGTFTLSCYTDAYPDRFVVTDANGNQLLDTGFFSTGMNEWIPFRDIRFSTRKINITVYCDPQHPTSSVWGVRPHCPD